MRYLRAKPLIDDITIAKPPILAKRYMQRPLPPKLSPSSRIPNDYESKLDSNLYADILSQPVRCDKSTFLNFPRFFLQKFVTSTVADATTTEPRKDRSVMIKTTLDDKVSRVIVRPEFNQNFYLFDCSYILMNKKRMESLSSLQRSKMNASFVAMKVSTANSSDLKRANIELHCGVEEVENGMLKELSRLANEFEIDENIGTDVTISIDDCKQGLNFLACGEIDEVFKQVLREKFKSQTQLTLDYNSKSKAFIQFIYKTIIYYS